MNHSSFAMKTNALLVRSAVIGAAAVTLALAFGAVAAFAAAAVTGVLVIAAQDYSAPARRWQPSLAGVTSASRSALRLAA